MAQNSVRTAPNLIPTWCEWGRGDGPVVLVAPHGGRRPPVDAAAPPRHLRVNDVYTPEITRELAAVLDATFIINAGMDRNALDLNRISQVRRHARWFLELLAQEIGRVIGRQGRVELVFIHGWNTGQASCDIGVGGVATPAGLHVPEGAHLTVTEEYLRDRVDLLRAACAQTQIHAPIGERYPGSHRNNLLQLFTARAAEIDDPSAQHIAAWVAEGRINALQLELGIPLRWPGARRRAFVKAVTDVFAAADVRNVGSPAPQRCRTQVSAENGTTAVALQFYDPVAGIGLSAGIGRMGPRATAGRLLLFLGGQRVALFTGEELHPANGRVGPLRVDSDEQRTRLAFSGPMLRLEDAAVYLDLEAALAASRLVEAHVAIEFSTAQSGDAPARFGAISGGVTIDGSRIDIETQGFGTTGSFRTAGSGQQTMLAAAFNRHRGVLSRVVDGAHDHGTLYFGADAVQVLHGVNMTVTTDGDVYTPSTFELTCHGMPPLRAVPLSRMPILRPTGSEGYLRVTFGLARFEWSGEVGYGLYEHARPVGEVISDRVIK